LLLSPGAGATSLVPIALMTRGPPSSTRFPYTTLFRSGAGGAGQGRGAGVAARGRRLDPPRGRPGLRARERDVPRAQTRPPARRRSEEHTSELQSRENLVCRLLPEKKKQTTHGRIDDAH